MRSVSQHMRGSKRIRVGSMLVVGGALGLAPTAFAEQEPAPEYSIKNDNPPIGSRIRQDQATTAHLPLNRTYQQLTPEQRAFVNSWYQSIAPGDEPPYPLDGLKGMVDAVRKGQDILLATGRLVLVATVEPSGKVSTVKAYSSPSPEMTEFASKVMLLTKFKPAVCGGRRCRMDFPLVYQFELSRE